jgi:hypothetical protein
MTAGHRILGVIVAVAGLAAGATPAIRLAAEPAARLVLPAPLQAAFFEVDGLDAEGVIVPEDQVDASVFFARFGSRWTPSSDDVRRLESGLADALIAAGARTEIHERLGEYRRQYLGVIVEGRRRILVNAFRGTAADGRDRHPDWRHRFVFVLDGGHDYWRILFDVESGDFVGFEQNGYA